MRKLLAAVAASAAIAAVPALAACGGGAGTTPTRAVPAAQVEQAPGQGSSNPDAAFLAKTSTLFGTDITSTEEDMVITAAHDFCGWLPAQDPATAYDVATLMVMGSFVDQGLFISNGQTHMFLDASIQSYCPEYTNLIP